MWESKRVQNGPLEASEQSLASLGAPGGPSQIFERFLTSVGLAFGGPKSSQKCLKYKPKSSIAFYRYFCRF